MATTKKNILYKDVTAAADKLGLDKNTVNMFAKAQKIAVPPYNSGGTPVDTPVVPGDTTPVKPGVDKTAIISNAGAIATTGTKQIGVALTTTSLLLR